MVLPHCQIVKLSNYQIISSAIAGTGNDYDTRVEDTAGRGSNGCHAANTCNLADYGNNIVHHDTC